MAHLLFSAVVLHSCLVAAKGLWSSVPASYSDVIREAYPVGNGRIGALPFGSAGAEKVNFNVDTLWSGGPFESSEYTGGNPAAPVSQNLPSIRDFIFENGTGNVDALLGNGDWYGSFTVLGNLTVTVAGVLNTTAYNRSLDLDTGIHTTSYVSNGNKYTSTVFCSYPDQVCVYDLSSSSTLPEISISIENLLVNSSLVNAICDDSGSVILKGVTQLGPPLGMKYQATAKLLNKVTAECSNDTSALVVPARSSQSLSLVIGAGTNYDWTKGNAASNFSFQGADPADYVKTITNLAAAKSETALREAHIDDYSNQKNTFTLELQDTANSAGLETSVIISRYNSSSSNSDPYLESLVFGFGRHLYISSERDNSLPTNLQGRWSESIEAAWSADYHSNINTQMNHWGVDQTGLGSNQIAFWNYMEYTLVPRGTETAQLLYGAPGWVMHDEINIFGHTGMKDTAQWANYPASGAWLMMHVWDHYDYSQNLTWLQAQGYPLIKGVAKFWLSQLQSDEFFHDGTLVVNPCNSPEHGPTTFACTHYQQILYQVFDSILSGASLVGESDETFIGNVTTALQGLDKGLHIGTWGEIKEWKVPDSFGYDIQNDTHRHLSHLIGWYPGHSITSFQQGYTNTTIQSAVEISLLSRGIGNAADANSGWEKVWRSACWARLNDTENAYFELRYAIDTNFASNGLSMYSGVNTPFQIDANFGLVGAMLAMLVLDLPVESSVGADEVRTVVVGPAIPTAWGGGSLKGLRIRGGGMVDFGWDEKGMVMAVVLREREKPVRIINKLGLVLAQVGE